MHQLARLKIMTTSSRTFALNDEGALVICDYGTAPRPRIPFPYFAEVMTGFEYSTAVLMLYSGMIEQGLECIQNIRSRYDGEKRNPWDEAECGHHYARAMASWSGIVALSGFEYDGSQGAHCLLCRVCCTQNFNASGRPEPAGEPSLMTRRTEEALSPRHQSSRRQAAVPVNRNDRHRHGYLRYRQRPGPHTYRTNRKRPRGTNYLSTGAASGARRGRRVASGDPHREFLACCDKTLDRRSRLAASLAQARPRC